MTFGHPVRLDGSVLDSCEILHQERSLMVEELVLVLLIGQQNLVHRLRHAAKEPAQLLLTVLASHAQLVPRTHSPLVMSRW